MKFLKWLLIVLIVLAGLILIVPIFLPSEAVITVKTEIALEPELIFQNLAQYSDRDKWDPWLTSEPEAKVTIVPNPMYVGSTYEWEGEKIGVGKMRIDSVSYPSYIQSSIWFGGNPEPSTVQWDLLKGGEGTEVSWTFISEGAYPFGRLMLLFMNAPLKSAFETGLTNLKKYLDENPPILYKLSKISIEKSYPTNALVVAVEGNMEEIGQAMMIWYPALYEEMGKQGLTPNGPAFAQYLDYDDATGFSHALLGVPVDKKGIASGDINPKFYDAVEAVAATHIGKYDYFKDTYDALDKYVTENNFEVRGDAFEVYLKTMMESQNPMEWRTMVAFPLKK